MFQKIIEFLKSLFGGKSQKSKKKQTVSQTSERVKAVRPEAAKPTVTPTPVAEKPKAPEKVTFTAPDVTLTLGHYDSNVQPSDIESMLKVYHRNMSGASEANKHHKFRHGDLHNWVSPEKVEGNAVLTLQKFLSEAGFLPSSSKLDGIFGYTTQAAVRMFQEYVRTIEGDASIGTPDGVVGSNGWAHIKRWAESRKTAEVWKRSGQSEEYKKMIGLLKKAKAHYQTNSFLTLDKVNEKIDQLGANKVDTLKTADWKTDENEIHLIGIRRKEEDNKGLRKNDDVFILLINGMVFKFWGSTDPNHGSNARRDEAFLVEGQHKFRFGWHNHSNESKVYQGLNPFANGVLVTRDWNNDNKLTDADLQGKGIENSPNRTINIHWTGAGQSNSGTWSAGCQVLAGQNYINSQGKLIDCSSFAAQGTADLTRNKSALSLSKTKGAYNIFIDLLMLYRPEGVDYLYYTLGRDGILEDKYVIDQGGSEILADTLTIFKLPDDVA